MNEKKDRVSGQVENIVRPHRIVTWRGRPIADLSQKELIEALEWCGEEIQRLQKDRSRWIYAGDPIKYMMSGGA